MEIVFTNNVLINLDNEKYEYSDKLFIAYNKLNYIANSFTTS